MNIPKFGRALVGLVLIFACMAGCNSAAVRQSSARLTDAPMATVAVPDNGDNPTAGAIQRSTLQAQATIHSRATAVAQASGTARARANAAATLVALSTRQSVIAAKSAWPRLISESFRDNALGWPLGLTKDDSLAVTSRVADGGYQWAVTVADGNSYWNLVPEKGPLLTDFYASVNVQFVSGEEDDMTSYGLVFRNVDKDYGFFGISKSGDLRILEVHDSGIYNLDQEDSNAIDTRPGKVNRIAVAAIGPDFVFFINNKVVGQMTADINPGKIGLGVDALSSASEAQVTFSDFEIYAP
ncbi:MAG: hypothetical protein WA821_11685 [Anaerolineales bacterium]